MIIHGVNDIQKDGCFLPISAKPLSFAPLEVYRVFVCLPSPLSSDNCAFNFIAGDECVYPDRGTLPMPAHGCGSLFVPSSHDQNSFFVLCRNLSLARLPYGVRQGIYPLPDHELGHRPGRFGLDDRHRQPHQLG